MTDSNIITVSEFGLLAPTVDTTKYDAPTLSGIIGQASKIVSDYLQYTPLAEDIVAEISTAKISSEGDLLIYPQKTPIQRVDTITVTKGSVNLPLNLVSGNGANKYNLDYLKRYVRYAYGELALQGIPVFVDFYALRSTQFYVSFSYRGGFEVASLPASIKAATVLVVRDILKDNYNIFGATRVSQGGISYEYPTATDADSPFMKQAKKLLNPYRRI